MANDLKNNDFLQFSLKLALIASLMLAPLAVMLSCKWPMSNDFLFYGEMMDGFSRQFFQGDWYPRWLADSNAGYGSPAMIFYNPLSFFLSLPLAWLAPVDPHGLARVLAGMWLALLCAGLSCRYWLKAWLPESQARTGALLYAGFPYLFTLAYFTYGIASLWAIACFPLVLTAIDRMRQSAWRGVPVLALAIALLVLAHAPSLMAFAAVPPAYAFAMANRGQRRRQLVLTGISGLLAALLCSVYLLPMLLNRPFIRSEIYTQGRLGYAANFFFPNTLFGLCLIILPLLALYLEQRANPWNKPLVFWSAMLAFMLFMVSPFSRFIWDIITPLQYLQFPLRFYNPMLPGAVFIAASWLPTAKSRHVYACLFATMLAYASLTGWQTWFADTKPVRPFLGIGATREYQTRWMSDTRTDSPVPPDFGHAKITQGRGQLRVDRWTARKITLHADIGKGGGRVTLHRFYFPGWSAGEPDGALLSVPLKEGAQEAELTFEPSGEVMGTRISLAALCLLAGWQFISTDMRRGIPQTA